MSKKNCQNDLSLNILFGILKKRKNIFIYSFIFFSIIGFLIIKFSTPIYKYNLIISTPYYGEINYNTLKIRKIYFVSKQELIYYINKINNLLKFSKKDDTFLKNLIKIKLILNNKHNYTCNIILYSKKNNQNFFDFCSKYIINFLNSIPVVIETLEKKKKELIFQVKLFKNFIKKSNLLTNIITKRIENQNFSSICISPPDMYNELANLNLRYQVLKNALENIKSFEISAHSHIPQKPFFPNKKLIAILSIIISIFFSFFIIFLIEVYNYFQHQKNN